MPNRILVVDDDKEIARTIKAYLEQSGFEVASAHDGIAALQSFRESRQPDLIVLDLMLPGMDGYAITRELRRQSNIPIIMLTARVEEADKLFGLELGADDYVTKPFSPRELVARVKAVLRRAQGQSDQPNIIETGGILLDRDAHTSSVAGKMLDLTPTEFALLETLMSNAGRAMSRQRLIENAIGYTYEGFERTIDAHIKNLRRKLIEAGNGTELIHTVYGIGYKFAAPMDTA